MTVKQGWGSKFIIKKVKTFDVSCMLVNHITICAILRYASQYSMGNSYKKA